MTGTIISGNYSIGITLTDTASNPVSVTGNITVASGDALYGGAGSASYSWTIANAGTIGTGGNAAGNAGLALGAELSSVSNGVVTNQAAGVIYGGTDGVYIVGPGAVTNLFGGSITGTTFSAVYISSGTGTITNGGVLLGGTYGVDESHGGSVTNQASGPDKGTITGTGTAGVHIAGGLGTVINAAVIRGGNYGIDEVQGGSVTNQSGGAITGTTVTAVYLRGAAGAVVNYGVLLGGQFGINEQAGGSVTNRSTGTITGTESDGIRIAGGLGTVLNAHSITSNYIGVFLGDGGSVTNQSGGTIAGLGTVGVAITVASGTLFNSGSVYGAVTGVQLSYGGSVTNVSGGTITGNVSAAVYIGGTVGAIVNTGVMTGALIGAFEEAGGSVTNISGGSITGTGNDAIYINGATGTIVNDGVLLGGVSGAVEQVGGSVTNQSGGTITGTSTDGVQILGTTGVVINGGSISGGGYGIYLGAGGTLTNQDTGTISSTTGILLANTAGTVTNAGLVSATGNAMDLYAGSTLTNSGTIHAGSDASFAVQFVTGSGNKLVVDPGAVFYGQIAGGTGEMDLASSSSAGTLTGFDGSTITNFGSLQFDTGSLWTVVGNTLASGLGSISIGGFNIGDTIDLTGFVADSKAFGSNELVLDDASSDTVTLNIVGGFQTSDFHYVGDGLSGTDIWVTATCYAAGTRIRTMRGDIAVEHLREGELVLTVSGRAQPIRWIGHRRVNFLNHPNRQRVLPVRIAAHAFGRRMPERALVLSPDHSVFLEDALIPIRHLINGTSIAQIECESITYYHVELPRHDVLLAEGLPAESYLEAGARDAFANFDGAIQLYPEFEPPRDHYAMLWESEGYAPLVVAGEQLERARRKLERQATLLMQARDALIEPLSFSSVSA